MSRVWPAGCGLRLGDRGRLAGLERKVELGQKMDCAGLERTGKELGCWKKKERKERGGVGQEEGTGPWPI
jgi:hypothetical protein